MNAGKSRTADTDADVEPVVSVSPLAAEADQGTDTRTGRGLRYPVIITVTSYRKRLCDPDGISAKAAIDGLVYSGVLEGDSPEYVREVRYRQVKSKDEKTVIEINDDPVDALRVIGAI